MARQLEREYFILRMGLCCLVLVCVCVCVRLYVANKVQ